MASKNNLTQGVIRKQSYIFFGLSRKTKPFIYIHEENHADRMATTVSTILSNKTLTTTVPTPLFSWIATVIAKDANGVLLLAYVHGLGTIILNSILLWLLGKKFPRDTNSLLLVIQHLCISDVLNGIIYLLAPTLGLIETKINLRNKIILQITKVFMRVGVRYVLTVSTFLLR